MNGQLFIARGDITQLAAHAIAYSTSTALEGGGAMSPSFHHNVPGFKDWFAELGRQHPLGCEVGEAFWMPLRTDTRPHGVVVVAATGKPVMTEDKAAVTVRGAIDKAVACLRADRGPSERLLVALPAFRAGMGGDRNDRLRSARAQVAAARDALSRHPEVDIAFILYTPALYQIFLEARRAVATEATEPPCPEALERAILDGECVLFAGAGLSRGAGLPDWGELVGCMANELQVGPHDRLDFLDLAQWYRERFGAAALAEIIRSTFADPALAPKPTLAHYLLMSLPVRHVVTTNYDDLLERALVALKRYPVKIVRQEDVVRTSQGGDGVHVIKLHGDAADAHGIVLCRDDYDEFFERRPALALLLEGLLLNQTFFFIGYGLRDPNFRQVYSRVARMLREARRPAFATSFETPGGAGEYLTRQWREKQLHLIGIPGATPGECEFQLLRFLDHLADVVTTRTPRLLLAQDAGAAGALTGLRDLLVRDVGGELEALCSRDALTGQEVRHLTSVLRFLTEHGWRPPSRRGWGLSLLWERLAALTPEPSERRGLLISALGAAEGFNEVRRIQKQLDEWDRPNT